MIRFFHKNYNSKELGLLARLLRRMSVDIPCGESECEECDYRHLCYDVEQLLKRLNYLHTEAIHNESV